MLLNIHNQMKLEDRYTLNDIRGHPNAALDTQISTILVMKRR